MSINPKPCDACKWHQRKMGGECVKDPCAVCHTRKKCDSPISCNRWNLYFRERLAYIHGYAIAHGIQPTTPPEEVNEFDEESAESNS